jgi:23S rRNA G2445 N2-methylase RlmL
VEIVPRALRDPRFAYRVADVPAASHPTIAAAIARASAPRDDDVVWDPFAGSGTELVERARLGPYARLLGTDIDQRALDAAAKNLAAAGIGDAALAIADATTHTPEPAPTLIVTNPPMGRRLSRREGALATLVDRFLHNAARVLAPGGRLVWTSPMPARSRERARPAGLALESAREVDMGGFTAELQVLRAPRAR